MARVYVSSTSGDLEQQRKAVFEALRRRGHVGVGMEDYVAEDRPPLDRCLADVRSCDVYIGIFGWRYGSVPDADNPDGLSYTGLEYRCAAESGKTCLIFLLSDKAPWPMTEVDVDRSRIVAFRNELKNSGRIVNTFETPDELARRVGEAVAAWEKRNGLAAERLPADWDGYRAAVLDRNQWVRLQVIAGVSREHGPIKIPLTEVFEPQLVIAGVSGTDVPDEVRQYQKQIYGARVAEPDEEPPAEETEEQLFAGSPERVLEVLGRERTQVILGGPGSGKSTLLQYAMLRVCEPATEPDAVPRYLTGEAAPFLVELRTYVLQKDPDFVAYLVRRSNEYFGIDLDADSLTKALTDGEALVVFDGLDEVFNPDDRRWVIDQFQAFARRYPGCRIVVTSRIAGYDRTSLGLAGFAHYTLMPLTLGHIKNFAARWYRHYTLEGTERTAEDLIQRIVESPRLLDLAGNPLLLTMMAVIYKDRDLPNERWRLYERCAETLLEDWDLGKGIETEDFKLTVQIRTKQKSRMLELVARHMLDHAQPGSELNAIAYGPLEEILAGYLIDQHDRPKGEAEAIAVDILRHLMERTYVLAGVGERIFGFVHRTFMEYFAARYLYREFNDRNADFAWLTEEIFGAHWQDPAWEEVLLLLIGMLHDQGTRIRGVVDHLRRESSPVFRYNLAFAARCLGEVGDVEDQAQAGEVLGELAIAIADHAAYPRTDEHKRFVETALGAFAALAPLAKDPPAEVHTAIHHLRSPIWRRPAPGRIAAWQMEYALRSRKERLEFALAALGDPEEAVRRGAIAALEREWPGRADIAPHLAEVVKTDRQGRVRVAALEAMQRSWRHDPAILDAIESRIDQETAYTIVVQLIEYLAVTWPGDPRALHLVMRLAEPWPRMPEHYDYTFVLTIAVAGVARSWPRDTNTLDYLLSLTAGPAPVIDRAAMFAELAGLATGSARLSTFLKDLAVHDLDSEVRVGVLHGLAETWAVNGDTRILGVYQSWGINPFSPAHGKAVHTLAWNWSSHGDIVQAAFVMDRAANDADPSVRAKVLSFLAQVYDSRGAGLPTLWDFVRDRAVNDPDQSVRTAVLKALLVAIAGGFAWDSIRVGREVRDFLWHRVAHDPDPSVRGALLKAIADNWEQVMNAETLSFLQDRAVHEPDPFVRTRLLRALAEHWGTLATGIIENFLRDRAANDPDAATREALCEELEKWQ